MERATGLKTADHFWTGKELKNMRFHKNVPQENREFLTEQLRQYEKEMRMNADERKALHKWVASGRSPYDNGDYICTEGGISA